MESGHNPLGHNPLGHNPDADEAELIRNRESFDVREHLKGTQGNPTTPSGPVHLTLDQIKGLARAAGLFIVEDDQKTGHVLNREERIAELKRDNATLLDRALLAEAAAAGAIKELAELKSSMQASADAQVSEGDSNGNA